MEKYAIYPKRRTPHQMMSSAELQKLYENSQCAFVRAVSRDKAVPETVYNKMKEEGLL